MLELSKTNAMKANTAVELRCNWDGDFELTDQDGKVWFYKREEWPEAYKHMTSLIAPASGDPK